MRFLEILLFVGSATAVKQWYMRVWKEPGCPTSDSDYALGSHGVSDDLEIIHDRNDEFTGKSWKMEGLDTSVFVLHACDKQYCRKADTIYDSSEPGNSGSTGCRTDDIASYVVSNVGTKWD